MFDLLTFALFLNFLTTCRGNSPVRPENFQPTHRDAPVPFDYHDEDVSGSIGKLPNGPSHSKDPPLQDMRSERTHQIFLRDRVVRSICKALTTFVQTGVAPTGRVKRRSQPSDPQRCGWWKSDPCGGRDDASCGFQWVGCDSVDSGSIISGNQGVAPQFGGAGNRGDNVGSHIESGKHAPRVMTDGDESELNLQLPSSAEWQRRFNSTIVNKEDD